MRILMTGARGFVGPYVAEALRRICGAEITIFATAKEAGEHPAFGTVSALDVTDSLPIEAAINGFNPTHVVHLAGVAAPTTARADPQLAWRVHVQGALNLSRAILNRAPDCWLLHVSSGLVYGETANSGEPLDEQSLLAPTDEYSVTKAAADLALGAEVLRGLKCIRLRPFNHTGAGQSDAFVVPAFAKQIARIEAGLAPPVMSVGNLDAERDFLDVRDVANAYALAVINSLKLNSGLILNIASGVPRRIESILQQLLRQSSSSITVERDPARMRPSDLPRIAGNADLARTLLGWEPEHALEDAIRNVLNDWRRQVADEARADKGR
jgi:GDP-4-dehydro-6-deoxy-D-mannose reductase